MSLKVGEAAPDFATVDADGNAVRMADLRGKKVVIYFYPMDETPGCTRQACSLRDHHAELIAKNAEVFGVSAQDAESHRKFAANHKLPFRLLIDTDQSIARAYDAAGSGLLGLARGLLGANRRVTYVIDELGYIAHIIDDPDVEHHGEEVLARL